MNPRLVALSGPMRGTIRPLPEHILTIGRHASSGLRLSDASVSRTHCTIRRVDDRYELADSDSRNGTFLNGIPITSTTLHHGDTVRIGISELVFLLHDEVGSGLEGRQSALDHTTRQGIRAVMAAPAHLPAPGVDVGRMTRDLVALFRIGGIIHSTRDLAALQRELLQLIFEVIPAQTGAILLLTEPHDEEGSICSLNRRGDPAAPIVIQRDLVRRAWWEQSAILVRQATDANSGQDILCLPLISAEKTLGAIYLTSASSAPAFGEDHIQFLTTVGTIAAITLENRLIIGDLTSQNDDLRAQVHAGKLLGESAAIAKLREFIGRVAPAETTVLIRGESGTGKEVVARAIHQQSPRAARPFIAINCAAIPEPLLESELFGHEKGAFTGAAATRKGKLEFAEDGTLFLDEIGELAPQLQAKLLRVLQQREFERVGGTRALPFAARVIAATNKNLDQAIRSGEFRPDLYYRLNVVSVTVPPLREHRDDIPLLALYFGAKHAAKSRRAFKGISREARRLLVNYSWPGNIRELENAIEHAIVLGVTEEILLEDLPTAILEEQSARVDGVRYHAAINQTKKELILAALRDAQGNYPDAARSLGIHPKYLHRLVRNLKIRDRAESATGT